MAKVIKSTIYSELIKNWEVNLLQYIDYNKILKALPVADQKTIKNLLDQGVIEKDWLKLYTVK